jgi:hypothetical protein
MRHVKSHRAGSAFVAFGFAVAMMGTTLPTPLYPLYDRAFGLAPFSRRSSSRPTRSAWWRRCSSSDICRMRLDDGR